MDNLTLGHFREAIRLTIEGNSPMVKQWLEDRPGSWGFMAGKAVLAYRLRVGRRLTDLERRAVWHELWNFLSELKRASSIEND